MKKLSGFAAIRSALSNRNFRVFTVGSTVSNVGTWVQRVAVGWLTWELTHSGAWLGIVAFADLFPTVVLAPLTGAVADRLDRVAIMKVSQMLNLVQAAALAGLTMSGLITIELLLVLVALGGMTVSFNQPVRLAIVPSLVDRHDLTSAIGINSLTFNLARFLGPMIAGYLIVAFGVGAAFAFNSASFLWFLFAIFMLRLEPSAPRARSTSLGDIPGEIVDGYRYAARHPGIGQLLVLLTVVAVCARPYIELLPGFADQVFGRGAQGLAWLTSMIGLGAMLGGLWLAHRAMVVGLTAIVVSSSAALAAALIAFASTDLFWLALPCLVCSGFAMVVIGVGEQTLIQNAVDPSMRGRVMGLYGMIGRGAPALGALIMGGASTYVGLQWPVAGGAILVLAIFLWALRRRRAMAAALEIEHVG